MSSQPPAAREPVPADVQVPLPLTWASAELAAPSACSRATRPPVPPPPVAFVPIATSLRNTSASHPLAPSPASPVHHNLASDTTTPDVASTADRVQRVVVPFVLLLAVFAAGGGAVLALAGAITHHAAAGGWLLWAALFAAAVTAYRAATRPTLRRTTRNR